MRRDFSSPKSSYVVALLISVTLKDHSKGIENTNIRVSLVTFLFVYLFISLCVFMCVLMCVTMKHEWKSQGFVH